MPTPKSTPQKTRKQWYRQTGWQLVAIVVGIAVIGTSWAAGGSWLKNRSENKANREAVARFDRRYSVLKSPVVDVLSTMPAKTGELAAGTLAAPDFQREVDGWLVELRKMDSELRKRRVPADLPELEEAKAVLVQGNLVYIDAVKIFALAALAPDPRIREQAIDQGNNLVVHAASIVSTGERVLQRLKTRFGIGDEAAAEQTGEDATPPIDLPPEQGPPSARGGQGQPQASVDSGSPPAAPPGSQPDPGSAPAPGPAPGAAPPAAP